jgi:hypothetical protein
MSFKGGPGCVVEGRVATVDGLEVPGAKIRLCDSGGNRIDSTLSDMEGNYRFQIDPMLKTKILKIRTEHVRFHPAALDCFPDATWPGSQASAVAARPLFSQPPPGPAIRRDLLLTPKARVIGQVSANAAEVIYQEALLSLNRDPGKALRLLKIYIDTGENIKQIGRAILLIAEHRKTNGGSK